MKQASIFVTTVCMLAASAVAAVAQNHPAPAPAHAAPAAYASASPPSPPPPPPPGAEDYRIGPDDVLEVGYWRDKDLSAEVAVRPDGYISLPLLNDVVALGLTPSELAARIRTLAADYLETPTVTVVVKQINSRKVFILGEVPKPGVYMLTGPTTVLQLIAMAGGLTDYADREHIAIIRPGAATSSTVAAGEADGDAAKSKNTRRRTRSRRLSTEASGAPSPSDATTFTFNYNKALRLQGLEENIRLRPGDTVLVR